MSLLELIDENCLCIVVILLFQIVVNLSCDLKQRLADVLLVGFIIGFDIILSRILHLVLQLAFLTRLLRPFAAWNLHHVWVYASVTAVLSNIVSNVPAVVLLKSLAPGFPQPHSGWLTLAMASTLAGNLTITGSVANIIVVERARPEVHIGFRDYLRLGLPLTLLTMVFGIAWLSWFH